MEDNLKNKAVSGVIWSGISRFSVQGLAFVFNMIIARELVPEAYGIIAMYDVFLAIMYVFIDSGFGNALMRKKDRTEVDISTVFYFNLAVSVLCYIIIFISAPFIADFYKLPILTQLIRVIGITMIINSIGTIQSTILTIRIDFKLKTKIALISSVSSGIIGIVLVYNGFGVWTLVLQQFASCVISCILHWVFVRWKPLLVFSWTSFREMFSYGSKLLVTSLMNTIYGNISNLIVGKVYSAGNLGEYSKANSLASFAPNNINGVIMNVAFPVLASIQDQPERLRNYYKKMMNLSAYIIFPCMIGLMAIADPLIRVLLTDKWESIIHLFQIACLATLWLPIHSLNLSLLQVLGRSDYFLKIEIYKKILGLIILAVTIPLGITAMCCGGVVGSLLNLIINSLYTKRLLGYGLKEQMMDIVHLFCHACFMGIIAYFATKLSNNNLLSLVLGVISGMAYYFTASMLFKFPELQELLVIIKERFDNK